MTQAQQARVLINQRRLKRGLSKLRDAGDLIVAAKRHAERMAREDFFDHRNFRNRYPRDRYISAGEVLYWTTWEADSHVGAVQGWMDSPGHRDQIMSAKYTHIGLARYHDRGENKIFWVGILGKRR